MQRKIALIVHALTVAGAVAGFSFSAAAQTHYRFAHDQQLNSGYSVAYDIFSAVADRWLSISIPALSSGKSRNCSNS